MIYKGKKLNEISFPIGGIGSGCIGLSGTGHLIDWEIFNRPNKGGGNGFSHFAVKVENKNKLLDARILAGDIPPPYSGVFSKSGMQGFGFGVQRETMAGFPHFKNIVFKGEYPFAEIEYQDAAFPGRIKLTAFNPFIPGNSDDSSIPGAFFEFEIENTMSEELAYSIAFSCRNPVSTINARNAYKKTHDLHMLHLHGHKLKKNDSRYGDICLATDCKSISYQAYWYRGQWFDNVSVYWKDFTGQRVFRNRTYTFGCKNKPDFKDHGLLCSRIKLAPGQKEKIRFSLTWNFPNCRNYWNPESCCTEPDCTSKEKIWKNYYATLFPDATASAAYAMKNWDKLFTQSMLFKNTLFFSALPPVIIDAIQANISILKTPTVLRLPDGSFYGFEGCMIDSGCCEGSCTHVWNYAYALCFLFPDLERSMRELDYKYNMREDGGMGFRLLLPLGRKKYFFRACADGQFVGIIKVYRDWKISGDTAWLKKLWPRVKKSIEFAWAESNEHRWDRNKDGVLEGRQHHTLDMELFGPNSWLTGFYLAALKAGAELAVACGDTKAEAEYTELFKQGSAWVDENLFNGEFFFQKISLKDMSLLAPYKDKKVKSTYWSAEHAQIKYQIGEGSSIDQVCAQWHANLVGLGNIFDNRKVRKALQSIFKYNFKSSMRNEVNPCRLYCLNDEAGTVICAWSENKRKPVIPAPYSEETMHGFEYAVACHMVQEGMVSQGIKIAKAVRDRYDGEKRNPWNEFECGSNYARSMASFAFLSAFSGFEYDMTKNMIGFNPVQKQSQSRFFWSLDSGWGEVEITAKSLNLRLLHGTISLREIRIPDKTLQRVKSASCGKQQCKFIQKNRSIFFDRLRKAGAGKDITLNYDF